MKHENRAIKKLKPFRPSFIAEKTGVSKATVANWKNGVRPSYNSMLILSEEPFNIPLEAWK